MYSTCSRPLILLALARSSYPSLDKRKNMAGWLDGYNQQQQLYQKMYAVVAENRLLHFRRVINSKFKYLSTCIVQREHLRSLKKSAFMEAKRNKGLWFTKESKDQTLEQVIGLSSVHHAYSGYCCDLGFCQLVQQNYMAKKMRSADYLKTLNNNVFPSVDFSPLAWM